MFESATSRLPGDDACLLMLMRLHASPSRMPGNNADATHKTGTARPAILFIGKTRTELENGTMVRSAIVALLRALVPDSTRRTGELTAVAMEHMCGTSAATARRCRQRHVLPRARLIVPVFSGEA